VFRGHAGEENFRALFDGDEALAGLTYYEMGHWLGGELVRSAGLAAVAVAPHRRGQGLSTELLSATLIELAESGWPLASLYPSTQAVYRRVGFEVSGTRTAFSLALGPVPARRAPLPLHRVDPENHGTFQPMYQRWARGEHGPLHRSPGLWTRTTRTFRDGPVQAYLLGEDEGYVMFTQPEGQGGKYDLALRDVVILTPAAGETLWAFLAGHRSLAGKVTWHGTEAAPWLAQLGENGVQPTAHWGWMVRVLDVAAAFEARGWPRGVAGALALDVADELLPGRNAGRWRVDVVEGRAAVTRGGDGAIRADIRALGPLLTGHLPATALARAGLLSGDGEALAIADRLLAGPRPWLSDIF